MSTLWSKSDVEKLKQFVLEGKSKEFLAEYFNRTEVAIEVKVNRLGLQLIVLSKKSLERRIFWNEFRNYELRSGKIYRVNNYKDNVLSRLSGKCEKSQHIFSSDNDIGFADLDYFFSILTLKYTLTNINNLKYFSKML